MGSERVYKRQASTMFLPSSSSFLLGLGLGLFVWGLDAAAIYVAWSERGGQRSNAITPPALRRDVSLLRANHQHRQVIVRVCESAVPSQVGIAGTDDEIAFAGRSALSETFIRGATGFVGLLRSNHLPLIRGFFREGAGEQRGVEGVPTVA